MAYEKLNKREQAIINVLELKFLEQMCQCIDSDDKHCNGVATNYINGIVLPDHRKLVIDEIKRKKYEYKS